jgi:hypothetical protein
LYTFKFILLDVDECIVICIINWTENKITMMTTTLIIPEPKLILMLGNVMHLTSYQEHSCPRQQSPRAAK